MTPEFNDLQNTFEDDLLVKQVSLYEVRTDNEKDEALKDH